MKTDFKNDIKIKTSTKLETTWNVVLFNCYCHSFDEAVEQITKAIGCSSDQAYTYARTAERSGDVTVFSGSFNKCEQIARTLGSTGLQVSVAQ